MRIDLFHPSPGPTHTGTIARHCCGEVPLKTRKHAYEPGARRLAMGQIPEVIAMTNFALWVCLGAVAFVSGKSFTQSR
jgi:hypothetical protein